MSDLAEAMPAERERIAGALRPIEYDLTADHWYMPDPVQLATDAVLPVVAELIAEAEKRGAVKALAQIEAQYGDERAGELTVRGNVQMTAYDLARRIESGEVAP